ncbi:hypothetical protein B0H16DRAFT_1419180 [Mycena metata]|uniref:TPR-like protein n=1 Tax=Mycena metata TaxID=1033252 RepID=A0AAD7IWI0_9AGAR|nr:hypothetical protein B0H16DRAFT_1419180 [Mycena metata]
MAENAPSFQPYLAQRFQALIWSCLDSDLTKTAVFYAERYFAMDPQSHESRHLYATALLHQGQPHSALTLVKVPREQQCVGCLELKAKCCTALGRHRQAKEALEESLRDANFASSASAPSRPARTFPDEAALRCRSGNMSLKGNVPEDASVSFRQALALNPLIWEAFEGLCAIGSIPEIDELFPPRPPPIKRVPPEDAQPKPIIPVASGAGFFTPDTGNAGNLFRPTHPLPFRMAPPAGGGDSTTTSDISFYPPDLTFQQVHPPGRSTSGTTQPHTSRPLSSADEAGPVAKKLRSTAPQPEMARSSKPLKLTVDEPVKKARARPALKFSNLFSSSGRPQPPIPSRPTSGTGKSNNHSLASSTATRRSTRLNSGSSVKQPYGSKHTSNRDRRRQPTQHLRSRSMESDMDEDFQAAYSPSPPPMAQSPRSETSPSPSNWTSTHEQAAQEAYEWELAEQYLYDLVRHFASATRALSLYDSPKCLAELEKLPYVHQTTPWVLAMIGRAHYEQLEYANAERAFKTLRSLQPYRLLDMEVYSTLLWHLQRSVELSFLAQELLSIDPRSSQAWIAVGNLFSLQKERAQALTCFRRAAQMDPSCAYAYTLSGHESIDEDLEKAINFFQSALRADPRHYNAWYGLGTCYLRMSKVRLAEYHYRKAVEIHPHNAVLLGCVGMAVERRGDRNAALVLFNEAVEMAPENALVRYRRSKILISMKKYDAAIEDLENLRSSSPEESNVVFQLAKVYRLQGNDVKSAQLLAIARDISPKSVSKIKKLLDTVKDEGGDDRMDEG